MNDYLNSIVARSLNIADVIQPRLPQLFEQPIASVADQPDPSLQTEIRPDPPIVPSENPETSIIGTDQPASDVRPPGFEARKPVPAAVDTYVKRIQRESPFAEQPTRPSAKDSLAPSAENQAGSVLDLRPVRELMAPPAAGSNQTDYSQSDRELSALSTVGPPLKDGLVKTSESSSASSPARLQPSVRNASVSSIPQNIRSEPAIRITIGRVDVRAIMPAGPAPTAAPVRPKPALSLESYLKQREEGKR